MKGRRSRRHRHPPDPPNDRRFLDLACISAILEPATSTGPPQENIGCCEVVGGRSCPCHLREALAGFDILSLLTDLARLLQKHGPYEKSKLGFEAINVFTHPFCILIIDSHSLEGLPFANESFDFVHIKRIARGVPEDHAQTSTTPPTTSTTPTMTSMTSVATTVPITIMFVPSKSTVLLHSPWDRIRMRVGPTTSPCRSPPVVEVPALDDNKPSIVASILENFVIPPFPIDWELSALGVMTAVDLTAHLACGSFQRREADSSYAPSESEEDHSSVARVDDSNPQPASASTLKESSHSLPSRVQNDYGGFHRDTRGEYQQRTVEDCRGQQV
ncbi:uncharacterized protein F5891DRAFT_1199428 [Suillus fuscotomentosus]|uniref:Uncharacterized protein n=1 Tax=Suillus fuscotomentosus TaxID=1912939 RepID=A0AAD4DPM3_9AGAM|nr:uncharacterized protein F5891DRAFT_1199428 [Suillus fuscotomentosus]KAG1887989.1 hypothetical protein F5891DRAFT_1199428 [Suillus fuscotomentosus]